MTGGQAPHTIADPSRKNTWWPRFRRTIHLHDTQRHPIIVLTDATNDRSDAMHPRQPCKQSNDHLAQFANEFSLSDLRLHARAMHGPTCTWDSPIREC